MGTLQLKDKKMKKKNSTSIYIHCFLILVSITMLVPFVWMFLTSFKSITESTQVSPFVIFPSKWDPRAYTRVVAYINFALLYKNTFLMILFRIICAIITASMAGYALGRLKFKGRNLVFGLVLTQMMVPSQIFIIPQYVMISKIGMTNTIFALVYPGLVTAFGTFLMRQNYMTLPKDIEEAAKLDGLSIGKIFLLIMAPLTKSSMIALSIFTALFGYKDLMWPLIVNTRKESLVLSSALAKMQGQYTTNYPELMAASFISCIPMVVLYIIFQRKFIAGIATTGGKL